MSDTSDFMKRLRGNDEVAVIYENDEGEIKILEGHVSKHWSTGLITVSPLPSNDISNPQLVAMIIREHDFTINRGIMSIRYLRKDAK